MRYYIFSLVLLLITTIVSAQPKHEIRAAWLTTAYALDWPHTKATSSESIRKQQNELLDILDKLQDANFNTIMFQARSRGDVFYASAFEPFCSVLAGQSGRNPGYDPLAFAIEECHKRGMECHAWIVALPLGNKSHVNSLGRNSVTKSRPSICLQYKNSWYLNPGNPQTKEYLMQLTREIVSKYDVDGVHFDYLRYPENATNFPDNKDYQKSGKQKNITQWRRDNLTAIVHHIYKGVKELKPWVKVSTSPVGKYRDTSRYSSKSWNAYYTVFQDVQGWLNEGIQDQVYPMMYFRGNNFYPFALDWQEQSQGRHIVPGLGIYFLDPAEGNWTLDEVERQIYFIRSNKLAGQAYYRVKYLMDNTQGIYDELSEKYYTYPALQPPMTWIDNTAPNPPSQLKMIKDNGYVTLTWEASVDENNIYNMPY